MDKVIANLPPSFKSLPGYLSHHFAHAQHPYSLTSFPQYYKNAPDPLHTVFPLFWVSMTTSYILGLVTGNVSQIDRQWTFLPIAYATHFVLYPFLNIYGEEFKHNLPRLGLMYGLALLWGLRLSHHTFRRGLYSFFDEDYRWQIWRDRIPGWLFQLFHIGFIAIAQSILLLSIALPFHHVLVTPASATSHHRSSPLLPSSLLPSDVLLTLLTLLTLYTQYSADNQQYSFQSYKHYFLKLKKNDPSITTNDQVPEVISTYHQGGQFMIHWTPVDAERGHITRGLWKYSRHPNFACEQLFWALQGLFPLLSAGGNRVLDEAERKWMVLPSPLIPAIAYSCLFIASTWFTESITAPKYKSYKAYQTLVGQFAPQATFWKSSLAKLRGTYTKLNAELQDDGNSKHGKKNQ